MTRTRRGKRGPGRPAGTANKGGDGIARPFALTFRLSAAELMALKRAAAAHEVNLSRLVVAALREAGALPELT